MTMNCIINSYAALPNSMNPKQNMQPYNKIPPAHQI